MQLKSLFVASLLTVAGLAAPLSAQMTPVAGTGCADGSASGGPITSVGGLAPEAGALTFAFEHACPGTTTAAFFLWGDCNLPLIDWDLSNSCFGSWTAAPLTCGNPIGNLHYFSGDLTVGGVATWAFPIPDLRPAGIDLAAISASAPGWCFQMICVEIGDPNPCRGVSEAVQVTITNP